MTFKEPIYVLPHGIVVIGEYAPRGKNPYWRLRIKPHPFFNAKIVAGGMYVRKNRAIMSSILGRALLRNEFAHHRNDDRTDDSPGNLEIMVSKKHNQYHHIGIHHDDESKAKISKGMKLAYSEGRIVSNLPDWNGRKHSDESKRRMSETRKRLIASGVIEKPRPPSPKGRKVTPETKAKMRIAALCRPRNNRGIFV